MRDFLRFLFLLLLILAVIGIAIAYYMIHFARPPVYSSERTASSGELIFKVYAGETATTIAARLADEGLIRSPWLFQMWARFRGMDDRLEAGRYLLRSDMTMDEILESLIHAPGEEEITFTIPEGLRLEEVAERLDEGGIVPAEEFWAAVEETYDYAFLADRPEGTSLEGYLFPDTYRVPLSYTSTQVLDFILQNLDRKFDSTLRRKAQERDMSIYEVVTLASIVEREAILDEERPIIASVYLNRLESGMPLEADPTVQYGLGYNEHQQRWWPELYFDELGVERLADVNHLYNTYRHAGLPPGPICSPGLASLEAVVEPAVTDYYFFVAKGDGSGEHAFARTLEEHNANVARYR